jgi:hypothetical protein
MLLLSLKFLFVVSHFQANVVCQQFGFVGAIQFTTGSFFGSATPIFSFDDIKCVGLESSLDECPHLDDNDCGPDEGNANYKNVSIKNCMLRVTDVALLNSIFVVVIDCVFFVSMLFFFCCCNHCFIFK